MESQAFAPVLHREKGLTGSGSMVFQIFASILLSLPPVTYYEIGESAPTEINIESQKVLIDIRNDLGEALVLYRVNRDTVVAVARMEAAESTRFYRVPSGAYYVASEDHRVAVAIPAFHEFLMEEKSLSVQIKHLPNCESPDWAWIPAGPAVIGDTIGIGSEDERPVRIQQVDAFWLGVAEVSNQQYVDFMNEQTHIDEQWIALESRKCLIEKNENNNRFFTNSPSHPVAERPR